ncbi:MAG: serine--tRNA ligase [Bacteroidota bacterium]
MLDLKFIRSNPELVREALRRRHENAPLEELLAKDEEWRQSLAEVETLKATRNRTSEEVAARKKRGEAADDLIASMRDVSNRIQELDARVRELETEVQRLLLAIPNIPHASVPEGRDERDNQEIRRVGTPRQFDFEPLPHWEIGARLGILDFERAAKISGARFAVFTGLGARLVRALANFMLDMHVQEHGYREVFPPFLVNTASMTGTGQLPKFAEDAFKIEGQDMYLVPTAEVPVTNLHRDEILDGSELPLYYVGYSSCFRAEAGSYGRDTRGLVRMHQFEKVELVKFVLPETSYDELEKLLADAEDVLKRLGLPYHVMLMCTGDIGFAQTKKYDPEVWMPSYGRYVEISSCSNFEDFQARRANIRFRREPGARPEYPHTLNGSGLAVGRTLAAILENYQQADGSVVIPEALRPYMGGLEMIRPA